MNVSCEWLSRLSFGTSVVALAAAAYTGCQETGLGKEPAGLAPAETPKQAVVGGISPDKLPQLPPEAAPTEAPLKVAEKPAPKADAAESKAAGSKAPAQPAVAVPPAPLEVQRLVVTSGVENREPTPLTALVAGAQPVYAFVELANPADIEREIVLTFEHDSGKTVGFIELKVPAGATRWRTWGKTSQIKAPGHWTAVVSAKGGEELRRGAFDVEAQALEPESAATAEPAVSPES